MPNASRDPWTDEEIRDGIRKAQQGGPDSELIVYSISLLQRLTLALETVAENMKPGRLLNTATSEPSDGRTDGRPGLQPTVTFTSLGELLVRHPAWDHGLKVIMGVVLIETKDLMAAENHGWLQQPRATTKTESECGLIRVSNCVWHRSTS